MIILAETSFFKELLLLDHLYDFQIYFIILSFLQFSAGSPTIPRKQSTSTLPVREPSLRSSARGGRRSRIVAPPLLLSPVGKESHLLLDTNQGKGTLLV